MHVVPAQAWQKLGAWLGVSETTSWAGVGASVVERYREPQRHYHTVEHLAEVLQRLAELMAAGSIPKPPPAAALLGAWFHDVVYDPTADDNEPRSADLARAELEPFLEESLVSDVAALVLATRDHRLVDIAGAELLLDADLSILGAEPARYDAYSAAIGREYGHIATIDYRRGRVAVLQRLLERDRLYIGPVAYDRWERPARANLLRELGVLR